MKVKACLSFSRAKNVAKTLMMLLLIFLRIVKVLMHLGIMHFVSLIEVHLLKMT